MESCTHFNIRLNLSSYNEDGEREINTHSWHTTTQHMNTCTLQHWIELTCSNTQAFSMLSWSAGRPSIFHCSCSLSLARKRLKSKCSNFKWSIHKERSWRRTSSGVYAQHGRIEQCYPPAYQFTRVTPTH